MPDSVYMDGGRPGQIRRAGGLVHRPAGPWSPSVQALLRHLRTQGFSAAPQPFGFDPDGNEIVSYLPGQVYNSLSCDAVTSTEALISAAELLRDYHRALATFVPKLTGEETWMLPARQPVEVICHGDFAPYNLVLDGNRVVGVFDFDAAHPGPRTWDLAYALYRWAPLTRPERPGESWSQEQKIERARTFLDAYNLDPDGRLGLVDQVVERLQVLVAFMRSQAAAGNTAFQTNLNDGHDQLYLADMAYLRANREHIETSILDL